MDVHEGPIPVRLGACAPPPTAALQGDAGRFRGIVIGGRRAVKAGGAGVARKGSLDDPVVMLLRGALEADR